MRREIRPVEYLTFKVVKPDGKQLILTNPSEVTQIWDDFFENSAKGPYGEPVDPYPEIYKEACTRRMLVYVMNPKPWKVYEAVTPLSRN